MQQIASSVNISFNNISRSHRVMLGYFAAITLAIVIWQPHLYTYNNFMPITKIIESEKHKICSSYQKNIEPIDPYLRKNTTIIQDKLDKKTNNKINIHKYVISTNDTLRSILNQYGIDIDNINQLIAADNELHNLKIGQQLSWMLNFDGDLQQLTWKISRHKIRIYDHIDNGFKINNKLQQNDRISCVMKGTVNNNFIASARNIGLANNEISTIIKVMQWQIDFYRLKKGDKFSVLLSWEMLNGKREQSQLIGAHLFSGGKDYYAIRANDGKFYDSNGICLMKEFLRFPTTKQFRISSSFNLHRLNPITDRITPHRGVDFAMPQGTPVLTVGDGKVIIAKHDSTAGFYIVVRHGSTYTTRYMHLRKLLVKPGQKVKRGDCIALSGNTGRSTGPHLHYEMWINQQAVNPLTTRLPYIEGELTNNKNQHNYMIRFKDIIAQLRLNN